MLDAEYITIPEAMKLFGNKVHIASIRRWIAKGVGTPKIKLRAVRIGGQYFTKREWINEFGEACKDPSAFRRERNRSRATAAKERLQQAGA